MRIKNIDYRILVILLVIALLSIMIVQAYPEDPTSNAALDSRLTVIEDEMVLMTGDIWSSPHGRINQLEHNINGNSDNDSLDMHITYLEEMSYVEEFFNDDRIRLWGFEVRNGTLGIEKMYQNTLDDTREDIEYNEYQLSLIDETNYMYDVYLYRITHDEAEYDMVLEQYSEIAEHLFENYTGPYP